jgi:hypothetical protein
MLASDFIHDKRYLHSQTYWTDLRFRRPRALSDCGGANLVEFDVGKKRFK